MCLTQRECFTFQLLITRSKSQPIKFTPFFFFFFYCFRGWSALNLQLLLPIAEDFHSRSFIVTFMRMCINLSRIKDRHSVSSLLQIRELRICVCNAQGVFLMRVENFAAKGTSMLRSVTDSFNTSPVLVEHLFCQWPRSRFAFCYRCHLHVGCLCWAILCNPLQY